MLKKNGSITNKMRVSSMPSAHACNVMAKYIYAVLNSESTEAIHIRKCNLHTKEGIKYKLPGNAFILITPAKCHAARSHHKQAASTKVSEGSTQGREISSQSAMLRGVPEPTNLPDYTSTLLYSISVRDAMYYCIGDITAPLSACLQIFVHDFPLDQTDEDIQYNNHFSVSDDGFLSIKENNSLIESLTDNLKAMFSTEDNLKNTTNYKLLKRHFKELAELYNPGLVVSNKDAKRLTPIHIKRHITRSGDDEMVAVPPQPQPQPPTLNDYVAHVLKILEHKELEGNLYISLTSNATEALRYNLAARSKRDVLSELIIRIYNKE